MNHNNNELIPKIKIGYLTDELNNNKKTTIKPCGVIARVTIGLRVQVKL